MLANALINHRRYICLSTKKKKINQAVLRSFEKACEYKRSAEAIVREYNKLVNRKTWIYVKPHLDIKPVPYT